MFYKKIYYVLFVILISFVLELAFMNSIPNETKKIQTGKIIELYPQYSASFYGYNITDNNFVAINHDPQIFFSDINRIAGSVKIIFASPLPKDTLIQVYYAQPGIELKEENSKIIIAGKGSIDAYLDLPIEEFSTLRVDINGIFQLSTINTSDAHINIISINKAINPIRFMVIFIILLAVLNVLWKIGYLKRSHNYLKNLVTIIKKSIAKYRIKMLYLTILTIGVIIAGIVSEYIVAYLVVGIENSSGEFFNPYRFLFITTIYLLIYIFVLLKKIIADKPELLFLSISLLTGSLFSFTMPANTRVSWDDETHYYWAIEQSYVNNIRLTAADNKMTNVSLPVTFALSEIEQQKNTLNEEYSTGYIDTRDKAIANIYSRIGHLPSAILLFLGRALGVPFNFIFIFGRWANVLVYSSIIYLAMKKLKSGKMIMAVIALLPTAVFLASNYSYDYWLTCFLMMGIAYFISEMQQPSKLITVKECIIMIGAFVVGLGPKAVYFPILFILFLIKKQKFKSITKYKKYQAALIIAILFVASSLAIPFIFSGAGVGDLRGGAQVNPIEQVKFILSNPIEYSKILLNFLKGYLSFEGSTDYFILFAYLGYGKYHLFLLVTLLIVVFTDKNENDINMANWKIRIPVFLAAFMVVALVATTMYIIFTPVAQDTIAGCQPRYLIPVIFPFLIVLGSGKIMNRINRAYYNGIIFGICSFILLSGFWEVCISKYY